MQRGTDKEELSVQQQNKEISWKAVKIESNSKIRHADEIDTLTLNNQFKCLEQLHIDFAIETYETQNINTQSTEKVGSKINIYIKTKAKFQTVKTEDQIIVSLKNAYKMINI